MIELLLGGGGGGTTKSKLPNANYRITFLGGGGVNYQTQTTKYQMQTTKITKSFLGGRGNYQRQLNTCQKLNLLIFFIKHVLIVRTGLVLLLVKLNTLKILFLHKLAKILYL